MKTKAVIFDLFETLITEFSNGRRISNRKYNYLELLGISDEDFKKEWSSRQLQRMVGELADYRSVIEDIMLQRNLVYRKEAVDHLYEERRKEKIVPFQYIRPDILELLDFIRDNHMKIGLVSNCTEEEVQHWSESNLAKYFNDVIFSYEVGMAKPDESIYLLSCHRLGVAPEETIFVGDGGSRELNGANRAGMRAFQAFWYNTSLQSEFKKLLKPIDLIKEL